MEDAAEYLHLSLVDVSVHHQESGGIRMGVAATLVVVGVAPDEGVEATVHPTTEAEPGKTAQKIHNT